MDWSEEERGQELRIRKRLYKVLEWLEKKNGRWELHWGEGKGKRSGSIILYLTSGDGSPVQHVHTSQLTFSFYQAWWLWLATCLVGTCSPPRRSTSFVLFYCFLILQAQPPGSLREGVLPTRSPLCLCASQPTRAIFQKTIFRNK